MRFDRVAPDGVRTAIDRAVAIEHPVAVEVNGLGYAVIMLTPADLIDFGHGFALSERLIDGLDDLIARCRASAGPRSRRPRSSGRWRRCETISR